MICLNQSFVPSIGNIDVILSKKAKLAVFSMYVNQLFSLNPKIYNIYQSFSYLLQIFGLNRIECSGYVNRAKPETEMDRGLKARRKKKCVKTMWVNEKFSVAILNAPNPVHHFCHPGVDSRRISPGTPDAPGDNAQLD